VQALKTRVPVVTLALIALPIVLAVDAGAVTLTKLAVPDDAAEAGRAGVQAIMFNGVASPEEAQAAFTAAKSVADTHHEHIDPASFTITKDGQVTLTISKHTGTILFKRLPMFKGLTHTTATTTVARASW
jgi:hypothetical protein